MGEWSKKIGDAGETIVEDFFDIIGWSDAQHGLDIKCTKPNDHSSGKNPRKTHGIDFLFSYPTPLIDNSLDNLIISSKFSSEKYPANPVSKFKDHFKDLATAVECFKRSPERQDLNSNFLGIEKVNDIGVLFWLSNHEESDDDVISKVSRSQIDNQLVFESIYLVDNFRISFLYDTMSFVKKEFQDSEVEYFYPDTGKNINPLSLRNSGKILPVQYINTSILPLRIENDQSGITLVLSVIDNFDKDYLKRLMGLAQRITSNFAANTLILFPNYNSLKHDNIVKSTKISFENKKFTESVKIASYRDSFRSLQNA
jgi:hypothetical protein